MAMTTNKMGLRTWNDLDDPYDHGQLAGNFFKIDFHDHTEGRGTQIPTEGIFDSAITTEKLADGSVTQDKLESSVGTLVNGSTRGTFFAHRTTTAKVDFNANLVFGTELFDVSDWYDSTTGIFTPQVAGFYQLSSGLAVLEMGGETTTDWLDIVLLKNTAVYVTASLARYNGATSMTTTLSTVVHANGSTDNFNIYLKGNRSDLDEWTVSGSSSSFFCGHLIGAE